MFKQFLLSSCLAVVVLSSCQKDLSAKATGATGSNAAADKLAETNVVTGVIDSTREWYGTYSGLFNEYPVIKDEQLIKNGVAQLPYLDRQFSYSNISYDIPNKYNITGDSIAFEAKLKNPKATGFSDYDVMLQLTGEQHDAKVHFVANADYIAYSQYYVGNSSFSGLQELVHYFGTFQTLKLIQKKYYTGVYINNILVYKFYYGAANSIGRLKTISIIFKGYGTCTQAGLRNSFTNKPILSEKFNIDGQSSTTYYY